LKKEKITMSIIIGLMFMALTALIFVQFRTIGGADISALELMRADELRTEIALLRTRHEEVGTRITETNELIAEYEYLINSGAEASELFRKGTYSFKRFGAEELM